MGYGYGMQSRMWRVRPDPGEVKVSEFHIFDCGLSRFDWRMRLDPGRVQRYSISFSVLRSSIHHSTGPSTKPPRFRGYVSAASDRVEAM
jgi:hypothetical protein